jgi:hypothetical protein
MAAAGASRPERDYANRPRQTSVMPPVSTAQRGGVAARSARVTDGTVHMTTKDASGASPHCVYVLGAHVLGAYVVGACPRAAGGAVLARCIWTLEITASMIPATWTSASRTSPGRRRFVVIYRDRRQGDRGRRGPPGWLRDLLCAGHSDTRTGRRRGG